MLNDGATAVEKYLTGYIVEKSLSVDNVFAIAMIFGFFAVPPIYQHRVLFWGILGALVMRGAMIALGNVLITQFHWILYLFAAFLILTALKMLFFKAEQGAQLELGGPHYALVFFSHRFLSRREVRRPSRT